MKKTKFSESQIVAILKQGEAGVPVAQILREHGISWVFRLIVTGRFGIVTDRFGNVTGYSGGT
jgi:hypothetical protein